MDQIKSTYQFKSQSKALLGLALLALFTSVSSCGGESGEAVEPQAIILDPSTPVLSFPNNNEACLETTVVSDAQSTVNFRWNLARNTTNYELTVSNLSTNETQNFTTEVSQINVTLASSEPYQWYVRSVGAPGSTPAVSDTWKFYLAGPAVVNYAPFPPELTSPISGATVTPINEVINLQWSALDSDGDLASFELYYDQTDGSTLQQTIAYETASTAVEIPVENGVVYYWKVIATDAQGNTANSGVFSFRTN
jgi:hypothetical protein